MAMKERALADDHSPRSAADVRFHVGDWFVEPAIGRLSRGSREAHLEPKVMQVLQCLALRPGELVSKREITDAVWEVEYITDNRLNRAVADLRRALEDSATNPSFVETIPTMGYRLVAPVVMEDEPEMPLVPGVSPFKLETADRAYPLVEGENIIGRGVEAGIRVDSEWVSRTHAKIVVARGRASIEDLGSKNGTYIRGVRVDEPLELHDGDEITVGRGLMMFRFVTVLGSTRTEA
jgi:DNA-binding winged helix-turn-helix (wHTH) protein